MKYQLYRLVLILLWVAFCFSSTAANAEPQGAGAPERDPGQDISTEHVVLGGGCFWCMEAVFKGFNGVLAVESGYAGGSKSDPTYHDLGPIDSQHAEVVRITFDPKVITLSQILTIFFHAHDPTTVNRQGVDVGPQYRSIILYDSAEQKKTAEITLTAVQSSGLWGKNKIVTEVSPLVKFYRAEEYHQDYFAKNRSNQYCSIVIGPKIQKIRREFKSLLRSQ